jgi:hypothetical protein
LGILQPVVLNTSAAARQTDFESRREILNVSAGEFLGRKTNKPKARATGKVRQLFDEVSGLPRRQQDKVVEFVSAFVRQQQQAEK